MLDSVRVRRRWRPGGSARARVSSRARRPGHLVVLALVAIGCGGTDRAASISAPPPASAPSLQIVDGDGQRGEAGTELPIDLAVRVLDVKGNPAPGATVHFSTTTGGDLDPVEAVADLDGIARSTWTLGGAIGESAVEASMTSADPIRFHASAIAPVGSGVMSPLAFETYDGSGQVVHPDIARVPRRWGHGRRYLAITPYYRGENTWERPSIFSAGDVTSWMIPPHGANPVASPPSSGYLSDPDVLFEPEARQLWLYYRAVDSHNAVYLMRSDDGASWDAPQQILRVPNHMLVSPSVVRVAHGDWHMWSVNASSLGCSGESTTVEHRTSQDGITWSGPETVTIGQPDMSPWHIEVQWIPERREYWALYNAKLAWGCNTPALYLATSSDGVHWQEYQTPVLERGAISQFENIVYRSTFEYSPETDDVTLWYSGARYDQRDGWIWSAAVERLHRAELFRLVARAAFTRPTESRNVPPLKDAP